jgi:hypothetical protein
MDWNWRELHMRDIKWAERLLSLFTSPDSAAGIVGDLSEERGQRGGAWFWRQVLGTTFSLCRGTWFESPLMVLLLVVAGLILCVACEFAGVNLLLKYLNLFSEYLQPDGLFGHIVVISTLSLMSWSSELITGAALVLVAPRLGMATCVLVAGISTMRSAAFFVYALSVIPSIPRLSWIGPTVSLIASPTILLMGGAIIRRRQIRKLLRTA